jgi:hypothetical protein
MFDSHQGETYRRFMGGDAYFYSHATNPYPFTSDQLAAIKAYQVNNLFCSTTGLTYMPKIWSLVENMTYNTRVPCSTLPKMNVTAWKE